MTETATATPETKTKKPREPRKPLDYVLVHRMTVAELQALIGSLPADQVVDLHLPAPVNVKKDKPRRDDFERGVKSTLESGVNTEHYDGKQLLVGAFADGFCYTAAVEEVTVRKVKVSKG